MQEVSHKAKQIKLLVLDIDGVLSNGLLYFNDEGKEYKAFSAQDGLGLKLLQKTGVTVGIISGRECTAVNKRMDQLGIVHVFQGHSDKRPAFQQLLDTLGLSADQAAMVGDDLPDIPLMQSAGLGIAVANARPIVKEKADMITQLQGGSGAVREVCEFIMQAQSTFDQTLAQYES